MSAIAANLEWLFTEEGDGIGDRVRAAAAAGITEVEIWGWRSKDLADLEAALAATGVRLLSMVVDPSVQITDPTTHVDYVEAVRDSLATAQRLGCPNLVTLAGDERADVHRDVQHDAVVAALARAAQLLEGSAVTLLLENLNTQVDHPGTYLHSVREGLDIVAEVASPNVKLLLDDYHAVMMGEDVPTAVGKDVQLVGHVQLADAPGRGEPGTGAIDWPRRLQMLRDLGYTGTFGLEYSPRSPTLESLALVRARVDEVDLRTR